MPHHPIPPHPPHPPGPAGVFKVDQETGTFTDAIIWTPPAGKRVLLSGGIISTTSAATFTLKFGIALGASTIHTFNLGTPDNVAFTISPPIAGAVNQVVSWSGGAVGSTANVTLFGEEI